MKRTLMLSFVIALLLASAVMASDTRVMTLGNNNLVLLDEANIWIFPSRINDYQYLAVAEFGMSESYYGPTKSGSESDEFTSTDFSRFGIHWKFGNDNPIVLGTYITNLGPYVPYASSGFSYPLFPPYSAEFSLLDNRRIDLFYGNGLGDYNFGAQIHLIHSSQSDDAEGDESKEGFAHYGLTVGVTPTTGKWDLALNVAFGSWVDENALGEPETEPDGYFDLSVAGRYFLERGPNYTLIPHAGVMLNSRGIQTYDQPGSSDYQDSTSYTYNMFAVQVGMGINYTPATNVLAVLDFGINMANFKEEIEEQYSGGENFEYKYNYMHLPFVKIGLDADVFKWMDVRFGAETYWNLESEEDNDGDKYKANYAQNETYLGFGFHWGRLHVDTYTDPELFLNGFDFISGDGDGDMNFKITAVYEMR